MRCASTATILIGTLLACSSATEAVEPTPAAEAAFRSEAITSLDEPWAMTFLPDGRLLVTEKAGTLRVITADGAQGEPLQGVPDVAYAGQGGLGDVVLHPNFSSNNFIYVSYIEDGEGRTRGAVVIRARLELWGSGGRLVDPARIWEQVPKVTGAGHYGHRMAFSPDGHLFISSGERQKFDPAQDMAGNLGKIVRLNDDGTVPEDNPFYSRGGVAAQVWSLGHRNPLGLAFDAQGQLWNTEMGPRGGDELNRVVRGQNYGYPTVSNGDHYSGAEIPDHDTRPEFAAPAMWWNPVISPAGLIIYNGELFPEWRGNAFSGGLSSQALVRIELRADGSAVERQRFSMGRRIREVEEGPDGAIWILEDGAGGRLLKLVREQ
ncbi:MAG: PQQ-dependent sugar dehydrogenase [Myxococcota bacterium]